MAWNRPTLQELVSRVEGDFSTQLFGSAAPLRRGVLSVLARVWAGAVYLLHLYLDWIYSQGFAHLASGDQLDRHGQEVGIYRKAPTYATGTIAFTGTAGTFIPQGTLIQDATDATEYQTTADATIGSYGSVDVVATALEAGAAGDRDAGTVLSLVSPITGVDADAITAAGLSGGSDLEADEDYRARILYKKRNPPQGGAISDYIGWATSVSPVTDAWAFPYWPEANSVLIRVANYNADPPTLSSIEVDRVRDYLLSPDRKPLTADVRVSSIATAVVAMTMRIRPNTPTTQEGIRTELIAFFRSSGAPSGTIAQAKINSVAAHTTHVEDAAITALSINGVTSEDVVTTLDQIPVLGNITFLDPLP